MKKILSATVLALGLMTGVSQAATILNVSGGSNVILPTTPGFKGYNPSPTTAPFAVAGDTVINTSVPGDGLKLDGKANVTFTFLGKEASFTNVLFEGISLFSNTAAAGTSVTLTTVLPNLGGFLDFKFLSGTNIYGAPIGSTVDIVNGNNSATYGSIAFKVIYATFNTATVLAFLNDHFSGDADYDDMVIKIDAVRVKNATTPDVPIPAGAVLLLSGLAGLGFMGRARAKAAK